jgi:two-component system phosphate regulon sensor histidine kinase PhoR
MAEPASAGPDALRLARPPWFQRLHWRLVASYALLTGPLLLLLYFLLESFLGEHLAEPLRRELGWKLLLSIGGVYVLSLTLASLVFSATLSRPLSALASSARRLATDSPEGFILVDRDDELGLLAESINYLAQASNARLRQARSDKVLLATILDGMSEGVVVCDPGSQVLLVNPAARALLGLGHRDPTGKHLLEVYRSPLLQEVIEEVIRQKEPLAREMTLRRREPFHLAVAAAPMLRDRECVGAVAVLHDITTLRQLERVRSDFVANVSHELRTPLASITGYAETLLSGAVELDPMAKEFIETIERHGKRLTMMVSDLLVLARVEASGDRPQLGRVRLPEVLVEVLESCEHLARQKEVTLEIDVQEEASQVLGEGRALTQVLRNLVENGIRYTQEGGWVKLEARLLPESPRVCIQVTDNGVGIEPQHLPRIFERFYRVDKGRSRGDGGTGLGLAIVKHMMLAMGGQIDVSSVPGQGSVFSLRLRAASGDQP